MLNIWVALKNNNPDDEHYAREVIDNLHFFTLIESIRGDHALGSDSHALL